jgi:hypothetical protein
MTMKTSDILKGPFMIELLQGMENEVGPTKEQQEQIVSFFNAFPIIDCREWENAADCAKFENLKEYVIDPILEAHSIGTPLPVVIKAIFSTFLHFQFPISPPLFLQIEKAKGIPCLLVGSNTGVFPPPPSMETYRRVLTTINVLGGGTV